MNELKTEQITSFQLNALLILFLLGSTVVAGLGLDVGTDAWIVTIISSQIGMGLLYFYMMFFLKFQLNFATLLIKGFGKYLGKTLVFFYILYFLYIASRVVKDFSYFIAQVLFYEIEYYLITLTFIALTSYACYLGIEAISRTTEILFFLTIVIIFFIILFSIISNQVELSNLYPLFSGNWRGIFQSLFPERVTFPYGELIVFTFIFPLINKKKSLFKRTWIVIPITAFIMFSLTELTIGLLGPKMSSLYIFPLAEAIELIQIGDVIQHLEILSTVVFFFVGFVKISLFLQAALYSAQTLVPVKPKMILLIFAPCLIIMSILNSTNLSQHLYYGLNIVPLLVHIPFQSIIPLLLFVILSLKNIQ